MGSSSIFSVQNFRDDNRLAPVYLADVYGRGVERLFGRDRSRGCRGCKGGRARKDRYSFGFGGRRDDRCGTRFRHRLCRCLCRCRRGIELPLGLRLSLFQLLGPGLRCRLFLLPVRPLGRARNVLLLFGGLLLGLFAGLAQLLENFVQGEGTRGSPRFFFFFGVFCGGGFFGHQASVALSSRLIFSILLLFCPERIDGENDQTDDYSDDYL